MIRILFCFSCLISSLIPLYGQELIVEENTSNKLVIGTGLGLHVFSNLDETRENNQQDRFDDGHSVFQAEAHHYYFEYYFRPTLAWGIRYIRLYAWRNYNNLETNAALEQQWYIENYFGTLTWFFYQWHSIKFSSILGLGSSSYKFTHNTTDANIYEYNTNYNFLTRGIAILTGAYADFSNETLGIRLGVNCLATPAMDTMRTKDRFYGKELPYVYKKVDVTGVEFYFDLRLEF